MIMSIRVHTTVWLLPAALALAVVACGSETTAGNTSRSASGGSMASGGAGGAAGGPGVGGLPPPVCGNGVLEEGEECDDGNNKDGDTCEANCVDAACNNGIVNSGEACFDGLWEESPASVPNLVGLVVGDCDGNGYVDLIGVGSHTVGRFPNATIYPDIAARRNKGDGTFLAASPSFSFGFSGVPTHALAARLDENNGSDLALLIANWLILIHSDGSCGWQGNVSYVSLPSPPIDMAVAQLDGDGLDDFIIAMNSGGMMQLTWWLSSTQALGVTVPAGSAELTHIVVADFDGDGADDVVFDDTLLKRFVRRSWLGATFNNTFDIYPSAPDVISDGSFVLDAGDFDKDGDSDIVAANYETSAITALQQTFEGSFKIVAENISVEGDELFRGRHPTKIIVKDFDNDGDADVVTTNEGDIDNPPTITLLFSGGPGSYSIASVNTFPLVKKSFPFELPAVAKSSHVVDINGDGALDFVFAWENTFATMIATP